MESRKRRSIGIVAGLLLTVTWVSAQAQQESNDQQSIPDTHWAIVDSVTGTRITLALSEDEVLSRLGAPQEKTVVGLDGVYERWTYDGTWLSFIKVHKFLQAIAIWKGERFSTTRGIKVGSSLESVYKAYGKATMYGSVVQYSTSLGENAGYEFLSFHLSNGIVTSISINYGY